MNDAERLQMFANTQRAAMRRLLEAIVPLRANQHLLWEKAAQNRLRNLLESVESLQRDGEWAMVRNRVQHRLAECATPASKAMLAACNGLAKEEGALLARAHALLVQVAKGDMRGLAPLRETLERSHVAALKAFDQDIGPLLALARGVLADEEWTELLAVAQGSRLPACA
jgi:hypothetical protein